MSNGSALAEAEEWSSIRRAKLGVTVIKTKDYFIFIPLHVVTANYSKP